MDMKYKRALLLMLMLCLAWLLCGCRTRVQGGSEILLPDAAESQADEGRQGEAISQQAPSMDNGNSGEPGSQTKENPEAARKEYDETAPAEIVPGTDRTLSQAGEGKGRSASNDEWEVSANLLNDRAEETATQTVAAETAEQRGVSKDADAADSALDYFTVLLTDRLGSLFECQRLNVYWETPQDHTTIHKTAPEHALILNAGCYDVSARLLPENLRVDDGWVVRKNPGVIVKIVDRQVLGGGIGSDRAAKEIAESLKRREGWGTIDAIKNKRILLLSEELLEAPFLQTAALVMIAKTANPVLFADVDLDQMLQMLTEEATGTLPTGISYYKEDGP